MPAAAGIRGGETAVQMRTPVNSVVPIMVLKVPFRLSPLAVALKETGNLPIGVATLAVKLTLSPSILSSSSSASPVAADRVPVLLAASIDRVGVCTPNGVFIVSFQFPATLI